MLKTQADTVASATNAAPDVDAASDVDAATTAGARAAETAGAGTAAATVDAAGATTGGVQPGNTQTADATPGNAAVGNAGSAAANASRPHSQAPENLMIQQALNRALADSLAADDRVLLFGEDVGELGGVFRVSTGLQERFGKQRVFNTPLAESGIVGTAVGLAIAGFRPVAEIQFDGFTFPAYNQIVTQLARMHYRSRGAMPMPVTVRIPSYGGIRAPEHHGESIEALLAHIPGLKVVSPADANQAYHLLRRAIAMPDPVMFLEPKSRYWARAEVDTATDEPTDGARIARAGSDLTIITWGAMVSRSLELAELAAEDGVEIEVVDLRWISPIDEKTIVDSVRRTGRALVVHEAALTGGVGADIAAIVSHACFDVLAAPVERVTGYDIPAPSGDLEDENIPSIDRILLGVQRVLDYSRG